MTVIEMAQAAGFDVAGDLYGEDALIAKITRLVELEREECAKLCEETDDDEFYFGRNYAEAIRTRGAA